MADDTNDYFKTIKDDGAKDAPKKADKPKAAEADKPDDEKTGLDTIKENAHVAILLAVEEAKTVEASVEALVQKLAPEFETKALEGISAVEAFVESLKEHAKAFADAVVKNTAHAGGGAPEGEHASMMKLGVRDDPNRPKSEHDGLLGAPAPDAELGPQNDAARAAVDAGMDVRTANAMTGIGCND